MTHSPTLPVLALALFAPACSEEAPADGGSNDAAAGQQASGDAVHEPTQDAAASGDGARNLGDDASSEQGPWTVAELCAPRAEPESGGLTPPRAEPGCVDKRCGAPCDPCATHQGACDIATDQEFACDVWGGCFPVRRDPRDPIAGDVPQIELTRANEGQTIALSIGSKARLKLQTIGPGQFEKPTLVGTGVVFEGAELQSPPNPGGPTQIYVFACVQTGTVAVSIPHSASATAFGIHFRCE